MDDQENLWKQFSKYNEMLNKTEGIDHKEITQLKRRGFFFDRLIPEQERLIDYLVPLFIFSAFFVVGYFVGIYDPEISVDAKSDYTLWVLIMIFGTYLMDWLVDAMTKVMQEADRVMKIEFKTQKKIIKVIFGPIGLLMSILIAVPFILYDITGFGIFKEGWLYDIQQYKTNCDNSWYPHICDYPQGIGIGSILWLVIWTIPWLIFGAFIWLAFAFLIYLNTTLKHAKWKDEIHVVMRDKKYKRVLGLSIAAYIPLAPFLAMKLIYQIFYIPWASDTIATYILFILFMLGVICTPFLISKEIDAEKKFALENMRTVSSQIFDATVKDVLMGKDLDLAAMIKANLVYNYTKDIYGALSGKVLDRALINKIIIAALAPLLSYLVKIVLQGGLI